MNTYTEKTIKDEGWYWFEPKYFFDYSGISRFVFIPQDIINENLLTAKSTAGNYTGPIDLDLIRRQEDFINWLKRRVLNGEHSGELMEDVIGKLNI